jgi:hypothetical protein
MTRPETGLRQDLAQLYEQVRSWALGQPAPGGAAHSVALVPRRGVAGWMAAWSACRPAAPVATPLPPSPTPAGSVPSQLASDIARVLANMILHREPVA